jgi:tetratricopeptide (TPR) repeat protein
LAAAIGNRAWGAWRRLDYGGRARWAGALAALVGLGVHSLVDDFFPFPAVGVSAMVLLAFVMPVSKGKSKASGISQLWLVVPALAAAVFTGYALAAYSHADRGIGLGEIEDWGAAASEVDTAAQGDNRSAFYWLQAGFVYAQLGETDSGYYGESIASYQRGIGLEPQYALNHANLGSLFWASSQQLEGLAQMRIATTLAPEAWLFWLNQGVYEESLGYLEEAESSFQKALALFPEIAGAQFWLESELRQAILVAFEPPQAAETTRAQAVSTAEEARRSIVSGDLPAARELLVQAYELNDQEVSVYVGLAELAFANGELEEADQYVNVALLIQATSLHSKAEAVLLAAEIALAKGESELALQRYQVAYGAILSDTSYGWGSAGWSPYAWFVFQRRAFPEDLVPQLVRADITTSIAERLLVLADLYESAGFSDEAQNVRAELQTYLSRAN